LGSGGQKEAEPRVEISTPKPSVAPTIVPPPFNAETRFDPKPEPKKEESVVFFQEAPANINSVPVPESGELARARAIAQRLGITNLTDDEYDVPTYLRRQQEREL
jgi:hypothetical protein